MVNNSFFVIDIYLIYVKSFYYSTVNENGVPVLKIVHEKPIFFSVPDFEFLFTFVSVMQFVTML